ncbi:MAG: metallophosphoesterase [Chitinophagaceae bacterium]
MKLFLTISLLLFVHSFITAQTPVVPSSYANIQYDEAGRLYFSKDGQRYYADTTGPRYTLQKLFGNPTGTADGLALDFGTFKGTISYGMIPYGKVPHPLPVFRFTIPLKDGKANINIKTDFRNPYDFVKWTDNKGFTIGYRLADEKGVVIFDGEVSAGGIGPFTVVPTIYEGPFVNNISEKEAVIWFNTTAPVIASVGIDNRVITEETEATHHEFKITGLIPGKKYTYSVMAGLPSQSYHFTTAPKKGSRKPFVFAYTSDSRSATGGGERNIYGANTYIMKKIAALAYQQKAAFLQFTGDMISGYVSNKEDQEVQFTNWKKAVEPFWHYIPFYTGQGNHEALGYIFRDSAGAQKVFIDKFPYAVHSAEKAMSDAFVNPENGPLSEDGNRYDTNPDNADFPPYKETVYYYTYDNTAMIVLNSDYWFSPTISRETSTGGGLHAYIMDNQLEWLRKTIQKLEKEPAIDHIFITQHTPVFPNGGHKGDDMWYNGNNEKRTYVAGKPVEKGIIERRDEYLDILINKSKKVVAVLTGDEHNYNRLKLTKDVTIYPENYPHKKLTVSRPIYQINNGAAGAPYYAQEQLPWSDHTKAFSVENAVCLFYVNGKSVKMKVLNPDTLNQIDEVTLR